MADFDDQSVFDWDALPVRSMYEGEEGTVWSPESLKGCRVAAFASRTEAWVASEMELKREEGLRTLFDEMCRRDEEEGWPLHDQLEALQDEDREDIKRIMEEESARSAIERKTTRSTTATRKTSSKQTPATATR